MAMFVTNDPLEHMHNKFKTQELGLHDLVRRYMFEFRLIASYNCIL